MIVSDQQREDNYQEYLRFLHDSDYYDVRFDDNSGGFSAVHIAHKFDSEIGSFGVKIGDYEKKAIEVLRKNGHRIILESEVAPNGVKTPDGQLDDYIMDIKATETNGRWSVKKKLHNAAKQGAGCIVLYFHRRELFSYDRIEDGWNRFVMDSDSQQYVETIEKIICIVEDEEIEWRIP